jgi:hypothetical protein
MKLRRNQKEIRGIKKGEEQQKKKPRNRRAEAFLNSSRLER